MLYKNISLSISANPEYEKYYWLRKELYVKSQSLEFGAGQLPSKFTEGLCNTIYNMKKNKKKGNQADSIDNNNKFVEIKCTQGENSNTTINKNESYNYLMWIKIDFKTNIITIKKYDEKDVTACIEKLSEEEKSKNRVSINLNNITQVISTETFMFVK